MSTPAALPPIRRIITAHDANGKAVVGADAPQPMHTRPGDEWKASVGVGYMSTQWPEDNDQPLQMPESLPQITTNAHPTGSVVRVVDIGPQQEGPLHFTDTLDYAIVLQGSIVMELDDKVEVTAGPQDFIVQRGTVHAWHNRTDEWCRILFVVLPAKEILVDGKVRDQPKQQ